MCTYVYVHTVDVLWKCGCKDRARFTCFNIKHQLKTEQVGEPWWQICCLLRTIYQRIKSKKGREKEWKKEKVQRKTNNKEMKISWRKSNNNKTANKKAQDGIMICLIWQYSNCWLHARLFWMCLWIYCACACWYFTLLSYLKTLVSSGCTYQYKWCHLCSRHFFFISEGSDLCVHFVILAWIIQKIFTKNKK